MKFANCGFPKDPSWQKAYSAVTSKTAGAMLTALFSFVMSSSTRCPLSFHHPGGLSIVRSLIQIYGHESKCLKLPWTKLTQFPPGANVVVHGVRVDECWSCGVIGFTQLLSTGDENSVPLSCCASNHWRASAAARTGPLSCVPGREVKRPASRNNEIAPSCAIVGFLILHPLCLLSIRSASIDGLPTGIPLSIH